MGSSQSTETNAPKLTNTIEANDTIWIEKTNIRKNYQTIKVWKETKFSTVSSVYCIADQKKYALKQIFKSGLNDEEKKSLIEEVEILRIVDHPNIMKIKKIIETKTSINIVSEYIDGNSLQNLIERKLLTKEKAISILFQLLLAINYCHKKNIIHRNITPENILVTNYKITNKENINTKNKQVIRELENIVKVIDFGIAEKLNEKRKFIHFMGNPPFTAPEMRNKIYNKKCDVWSAGIIFYLMLSSQNYIYALNKSASQKTLYDELNIMYKNSEICYNIKDIITSMINKDPKKRISAENALKHAIFKSEKIKDTILDVFSSKKAKRMKRFESLGEVEKRILLHISRFIFKDDLKNELTESFKKIDINNDGVLSCQEIMNALKESKIDPTITQEIYNIILLKKDEEINYSEFIASITNWHIADEMGFFEKAFYEFDTDKSGYLEKNELINITKGIDENVLNEFIKNADKDKNGKIDIYELKEHIIRTLFNKT